MPSQSLPVQPMLDLRAQYATIREEVLAAVSKVFEDQAFVLGSEVAALEQEIAAYCRTPYAVACASGTDALILAMMALDIGPGDEVITVPYTFFATASSITRVGALPVFVDILDDTMNMDPDRLARVIAAHPKAKAVVPVHLFGACADMDPILDIAARHGLHVIEDSAQSIGAAYKGRMAGSMGVIGCFSFFPTKNLGGCGDGGIMTTSGPRLAKRLASLRVHGMDVKYYHDEIGINSRLDALQATILRVKLHHLDSWTRARQAVAARYIENLQPLGAAVKLPVAAAHPASHVYHQFVIRAADRDALRNRIEAAGIRTDMYYPLPLHLQKCFEYLGYKPGDLPVSEAASRECIALPIYPEMKLEAVDRVCAEITSHYN
ncbi:MAG TPA: DegT/DnrJ/EryC1/StrS family aminotransferase [Bryobacteraceae bacterium]|nr:DegT/DnrJ/EryC1/StrS family aminotransferase [Bryobacteraceae bacterium]